MIRKYRTAIAFVALTLFCTAGAWRSQTANERLVREKNDRVHALCVAQSHNFQIVDGVATWIVDQTKRNPQHNAAQLEAANEFAAELRQLNGPEVRC